MSYLLSFLKQRQRWCYFAVTAILLLFLALPNVKDNQCTRNVYFYDSFSLTFNCDTGTITGREKNQVRLFTEFHNWKGRPVYLTYGILASWAIMPITQPAWYILLKPGAKSKASVKQFGRHFNVHIAFILLNILVLFTSIKMALRVSAIPITSALAVSMTTAVASYDLVHASAFMMHTTIFNLLTAIGIAFYFLVATSQSMHSYKQTIFWGILVGLGILTYPALALLAPAYVLGSLYKKETSWKTWFLHNLYFSISVLILPFIWYVLNNTVLESDVYLTAKYGQFVWVIEAWQNNEFMLQVTKKYNEFIRIAQMTFGKEIYLALASFIILLVAGRSKFFTAPTAPIVIALLLAIVSVVVFNFLQGYYAPRMHVSVLILCYILIGHIVYSMKMEKLGIGLLAIISAYQIYDAILHPALSK